MEPVFCFLPFRQADVFNVHLCCSVCPFRPFNFNFEMACSFLLCEMISSFTISAPVYECNLNVWFCAKKSILNWVRWQQIPILFGSGILNFNRQVRYKLCGSYSSFHWLKLSFAWNVCISAPSHLVHKSHLAMWIICMWRRNHIINILGRFGIILSQSWWDLVLFVCLFVVCFLTGCALCNL